MGCDIHSVAEKREGDEWVSVDHEPFRDGRSYAVFGWLADVRNYSAIPHISDPRGFPADFDKTKFGYEAEEEQGNWYSSRGYSPDYHTPSWLTVSELLAVDYEQIVEDRRVTRQLPSGIISGGVTGEPGEGTKMTLREFLGEWYFGHLDKLKELGAERIVFCFDS